MFSKCLVNEKIYLYHWIFTTEALQLPRRGSWSQDLNASCAGGCLLDPSLSCRAVPWTQDTFPCLPAEPTSAELTKALPLLWSNRGMSKVTLTFWILIYSLLSSVWRHLLVSSELFYLLCLLFLSLQGLKIRKSSSFFVKFSQREPAFLSFLIFIHFTYQPQFPLPSLLPLLPASLSHVSPHPTPPPPKG